MSLSDSSDSSRGRSIPVYKRKMVWSSSDGSEAARDEDLPDDPEAVLHRRARPPAPDEAGVSRWQDVPELPVFARDRGPSFLDRIPEPFQCTRRVSCSEVSLDQTFLSREDREGVKGSSRKLPRRRRAGGEGGQSSFRAFDPIRGDWGQRGTVDPEVIVDPAGSGVDLTVSVAHPEVPEGIRIGDVAGRAPEFGSTLVVGLPAGGKLNLRENALGGSIPGIRARGRRKLTALLGLSTKTGLPLPILLPLVPGRASRPGGFGRGGAVRRDRGQFPKGLLLDEHDGSFLRFCGSRVRSGQGAAELARRETKNGRGASSCPAEAEAAIKSLNRLLTEKSLREAEVARAAKAAKRELTEEFAEKVKATEAKLGLFDKVSERYIYLSQAKANAELIEALESGGTIEEEKEEVLKWKEEYGMPKPSTLTWGGASWWFGGGSGVSRLRSECPRG
ncbi:hypothetical protein ISN45_Un127g000020 [Arabidopsis thaliana x Arabidopsis arenosa]|uniref:Uncharacterized protein n=1 Tax=Arabidopsis thaliana x Arabidopsis arenosa TaxID=1240361 RepID=A0A8T1XHE5_9BRAS|nr:hypothetical protein ISN45_Un127g000020 [Arabidopsis thaliana x Arabidopsis arenosa]